jgi:hypothetical protein
MHNLSDPNQHQAKEFDSFKSVTNIQIHECSHRHTHQQSSNNLGSFMSAQTYLPTPWQSSNNLGCFMSAPTYLPTCNLPKPWQSIEKTSTSTSIQTWVPYKKSSSIKPVSQSVSHTWWWRDLQRRRECLLCLWKKSPSWWELNASHLESALKNVISYIYMVNSELDTTMISVRVCCYPRVQHQLNSHEGMDHHHSFKIK